MRSTLEDEHKQYLDALSRAAGEANDMVQGLLELSRIGKNKVTFEKIHTSPFLKELINSLCLPVEVNIKIATVKDWPWVEADSVMLRQIFQNLIENAVKFGKPQNQSVELGWHERTGESYEFFVSDNGIGIEQGYHEQIFQVFQRLHTSEEYEGNGIGLAVVKRAVSKLGGSIRVESQIGEGSKIWHFFNMIV